MASTDQQDEEISRRPSPQHRDTPSRLELRSRGRLGERASPRQQSGAPGRIYALPAQVCSCTHRGPIAGRESSCVHSRTLRTQDRADAAAQRKLSVVFGYIPPAGRQAGESAYAPVASSRSSVWPVGAVSIITNFF